MPDELALAYIKAGMENSRQEKLKIGNSSLCAGKELSNIAAI